MINSTLLSKAQNIEQEVREQLSCYTQNGQERLWEALKYCHEYLVTDTNSFDAWDLSGDILIQLRQYTDAIDCYYRAAEIDKNAFNNNCRTIGSLLRSGNYKYGWMGFERRLASIEEDIFYKLLLNQPRWCGEILHGKTILIHTERGLGDSIQFMRFLPLVRERLSNCRLILVVQEEIICLLNNFSHCYDEIIPYSFNNALKLPPFDFIVSLMSLPYILQIEDEASFWHKEYILPKPNHLNKILTKAQRKNSFFVKDHLNVGLVWGTSVGADDKLRSLSLNECLLLTDIPNVNWHSLQKGFPAGDITILINHGFKIIDLEPHITNFCDTAALLDKMDLLVTVDTSVAHLAGAMGKKTLLLLNTASAEWRWRPKQVYSAWYPSVQLFYQECNGRWFEPLQKIAHTIQSAFRNRMQK